MCSAVVCCQVLEVRKPELNSVSKSCSRPPAPHPTPSCLQNSVLKTWKGEEGNVQIAQEALLKRAKANSQAQLGKYDPAGESSEAAKGMFEKGYT